VLEIEVGIFDLCSVPAQLHASRQLNDAPTRTSLFVEEEPP